MKYPIRRHYTRPQPLSSLTKLVLSIEGVKYIIVHTPTRNDIVVSWGMSRRGGGHGGGRCTATA